MSRGFLTSPDYLQILRNYSRNPALLSILDSSNDLSSGALSSSGNTDTTNVADATNASNVEQAPIKPPRLNKIKASKTNKSNKTIKPQKLKKKHKLSPAKSKKLSKWISRLKKLAIKIQRMLTSRAITMK